MDWEKYAKQLMEGENARELQRLTASEAGASLAARFDGEAIEKAAREGDAAALTAVLRDVLGTPEGRRFAAQVQKAVDANGR